MLRKDIMDLVLQLCESSCFKCRSDPVGKQVKGLIQRSREENKSLSAVVCIHSTPEA